MSESDELWYDDDLDDRVVQMNREDAEFDLVERAERICDDHTNWQARVLARFVSSLKVAIAQTSNDGLKKRMKHVRGRLLGILAERNEKRVDVLLQYINKQLGDAESHLALAQQEAISTAKTVEYFGVVEDCFPLIVSLFQELQTRKYLQEPAKKRQSEIDLLKEKLAQLRTEYQKRPQVVQAAIERSVQRMNQEAQRILQEAKESEERIRETLAEVARHLKLGNLGVVESLLTPLCRLSLDGELKTDLQLLIDQWVLDSAKRGRELKKIVDSAFSAGDLETAKQNVELLATLTPQILAEVLKEEPAMYIERMRRRCNDARRRPQVVR